MILFSAHRSGIGRRRREHCNQPYCTRKNLFEKIPSCLYIATTRLSFWFYLILFVFQCAYSTKLSFIVTLFPIVSTLFSALILDNVNKLRRKRYIQKINDRTCTIMRECKWIDCKWSEVSVGDIIKLRDGDLAPADLILLRTSDGQQTSIETHIIDGSTQWQPRSAPLLVELSYENAIINTTFTIRDLQRAPSVEVLNTSPSLLTKFNLTGTLEFAGKQIELTNKNYIERYSVIHHEGDIICGVVYIGEDSSSVKSTASKKSLTKVEEFLRKQNKWEIILCVLLSLICALVSMFNNKSSFSGQHSIEKLSSFFQIFMNFLVLFSPFVPLELYFFVDVVLLFNTNIIQHNYPRSFVNSVELVNEITSADTLVISKSMLLERKPILKRIYLNNKIYGDEITTRQYVQSIDKENQINPENAPKKTFFDPDLTCSDDTRMFFLHLTLCHSASIIGNRDKFHYISRFHDDEQLLQLAAKSGFMLIGRKPEESIILVGNQTFSFKTKKLFHTTIKHPRVTIIVEDSEGSLILFSRGVFKVMYQLLENGDEYMDMFESFRNEGIHVEILMYRYISKKEYAKFEEKLDELGEDNKEFHSSVIEAFESGCKFLSILGFEDQPRSGSLLFLSRVKNAFNQIVIASQAKGSSLVLTETALGIIQPDPIVGSIKGASLDDVDISVSYLLERDNFDVLIISGNSIEHLTTSQYNKEILQAIMSTPTIILQKANHKHVALFVQYLRKYAEQNIMAVGHSVYDNVYMDQSNFSVSVPTNEIRPNNIGADLVVKDFTQLADIIFVDGNWIRERIRMLLSFITAKNFVFAALQFWYSILCHFDGSSLFPAQYYPLIMFFFTFLPILTRSVMNKTYSKEQLLSDQTFYNVDKFQITTFASWIFRILFSFFIALLFMIGTIYSITDNIRHYRFAYTKSFFHFAILTEYFFSCLFYLIPTFSSWSIFELFSVIATILSYFALMYWNTNTIYSGKYKNVFRTTFRSIRMICLIIMCSAFSFGLSYIKKKKSRNKSIIQTMVRVESMQNLNQPLSLL